MKAFQQKNASFSSQDILTLIGFASVAKKQQCLDDFTSKIVNLCSLDYWYVKRKTKATISDAHVCITNIPSA